MWPIWPLMTLAWWSIVSTLWWIRLIKRDQGWKQHSACESVVNGHWKPNETTSSERLLCDDKLTPRSMFLWIFPSDIHNQRPFLHAIPVLSAFYCHCLCDLWWCERLHIELTNSNWYPSNYVSWLHREHASLATASWNCVDVCLKNSLYMFQQTLLKDDPLITGQDAKNVFC